MPDVVALLIAYLTPLAGGAPVSTRIPNPRPATFVQVRRVGGLSNTPVRDRPRIDVIVWAATEGEAMTLALTLRTVVWALAGKDLDGVPVYRVEEFLAPRQTDDTDTGTPQVWTTYSLDVRADDLIHQAP